MSNLLRTRGAYRLSGRQFLSWSPDTHPGVSRKHLLRVPLQDVTPAALPGVIGAHRSADGSTYEVFTSASQVQQVEATVRYDQQAESLMQMVADGASGYTLTFWPDVEDGAWSYDVELVEPTGERLAQLSRERGIFREFDATVRLQKADGSAFGPELFSGHWIWHRSGWDLSRATVTGAGGTYTDITGTSQSAGAGVLRDAHYVRDEDSNWVRSTKLSTTDGDAFALPFTHVPAAGSLYLKFVERGSTSGTQLQIGTSGTGATLTVDADASDRYSVTHDNGSSTVSSGVASAVSAGDVVELNVRLRADGSVDLQQATDGGSIEAASISSALALADSWSAEDIGLCVSSAAADHIVLAGAPEVRSMAEMRGLAGEG